MNKGLVSILILAAIIVGLYFLLRDNSKGKSYENRIVSNPDNYKGTVENSGSSSGSSSDDWWDELTNLSF